MYQAVFHKKKRNASIVSILAFQYGGAEGIDLHFRCAKIMVRRHPAGGKQMFTGHLHFIGSIPALSSTIKNSRPEGRHFYGGAEGNRTPVRKQLGRNFSGRSLLFTFPQPDGNKHPAGISSFIMHGALKALRTHGLHSNHTRARLVDLPGRMGA